MRFYEYRNFATICERFHKTRREFSAVSEIGWHVNFDAHKLINLVIFSKNIVKKFTENNYVIQ